MSASASISAVTRKSRSPLLNDTALLVYIALATVVLHLILGNRYGWNRDELATLEDARHLAWGYPAYPPVTPFFGRLSLELFGTSVRSFRFFANLSQAAAVVLTGLMARDMGAGRGAQLVAAVAALPFCLGGGYQMMYVAFDALAWVATAYCIVRLLKSEDPRWWGALAPASASACCASTRWGSSRCPSWRACC